MLGTLNPKTFNGILGINSPLTHIDKYFSTASLIEHYCLNIPQ
ncbi:hypothetical protein LDG_6201 [Legionella drancourtii LLAP12]|uniref:Uncharacterized protein n=1 Tax=Legionella drancourtii LLAP12 TaxID=658187 RepID=G9ELU1_9GAMM|nr:hypothetical protein LDG_6201 [Legionella drancourtii LLAP12]